MLINESYPISGQMIMNSTLSPKKGFFPKGTPQPTQEHCGRAFQSCFCGDLVKSAGGDGKGCENDIFYRIAMQYRKTPQIQIW